MRFVTWQDWPDSVERDFSKGDEDVAIMRLSDGQAVVVPKSLERASDEAKLCVRRLLELSAEADRIQADILDTVREGRELNLSWESLGWGLRLTGSAVRKRFGDL